MELKELLINKVEKLELPNWEEFQKKKEFIFYNKYKKYCLSVLKEQDINCISLDCENFEKCYVENICVVAFTKYEYYNLLKVCKDLFLEKLDGSI